MQFPPPCSMFKCPSCLKQKAATCLIQSMQFAFFVCICTGWKATRLPFAHPHVPKLPPFHSSGNHTPHFSCIKSCEALAGSLLCMMGERENVTWELCFWGYSFSSSPGDKCCACKSQARWAEIHFRKCKLLSATRNHHLHMHVRGRHCPLPYISPGLTSKFTLRGFDGRWANTKAWTCVRALGCVVRWSRRGVGGIQSLTQRSRDRRVDTLQVQNHPGSIHGWNDRITGVLENLLRWLIMLFMVQRHMDCREEVKLFD